jgi:hypothetical protein
MTTLTATDLRDYIIGAWTLESYQSLDLDGSDVRYPLGADARGIIMYTPDGYMSAQIMRSDRPQFQVGDLSAADKNELATAASGYLAYTGPYTVDDNGVLAHHVDVSLLPNWIGGTQYRAAQIGDSRLELSPIEPVLIEGQHRSGRLLWRRAQPRV